MKRLFAFFSSLKLAVFVLLSLSASLATGTILESLYDTPTAQYFVYRSIWFHGVLGLLGVNMLCAALSRYPWKRRHIPFLMAHAGILMLLTGSFITERIGLDGSMRVTEGETSSVVEIDNPQLMIMDQTKVSRVPLPWIPPSVSFRKFSLASRGLPYDLTVDRYISHADPEYSFIPVKGSPNAALQLRIQGGPMQITQDLWLFAGDPGMRTIQMGPAEFSLGILSNAHGHPSFSAIPEKDGSLSYVAKSSDGKVLRGSIAKTGINGKVIEPGWKGNVKLTLLSFVPESQPLANYHPSKTDHGKDAPGSAIHIISGKGGPGAEAWLGLGERALLTTAGHEVEIGYYPQRLVLPFSIRLEHFSIDRYEGTNDPASYASSVSVIDGGAPRSPVTISMNEPLTQSGTTLYQASYEDAQPRPVTSIFSVNRDPGRKLKYYGSLLIVLGTIVLFAVKYLKRKSPS